MDIVTALALSIGLLGALPLISFFPTRSSSACRSGRRSSPGRASITAAARSQGFISSVLANLWGVVWGALTLIAFSNLDFGLLGLPVWAGICVAIGVALMILGCKIPIFSAIPATVYGYAAPSRWRC